jgi:hypothetical protein
MEPKAAIRSRGLTLIACSLLLSGCFGLFDSGIPWRSGPYALTWVDLPDEVMLSYDLGNGGWATLVDSRVFAVGANQQYVVAKQHPHGDKTVTNYFIIEIRAGRPVQDRISKDAVIGPLDEKTFRQKAADLALPSFTKTLESLQ